MLDVVICVANALFALIFLFLYLIRDSVRAVQVLSTVGLNIDFKKSLHTHTFNAELLFAQNYKHVNLEACLKH